MEYEFGRINDLAARIHAIARSKGFHEYRPSFGVAGQDTRHILSWLMLITTEVAEAAEAARKGDLPNFSEEMADIVIRILDTTEALGINIEQEIVNKIEINRVRGMRHGGKLA